MRNTANGEKHLALVQWLHPMSPAPLLFGISIPGQNKS